MSNTTKIIEIKGEDWKKGISIEGDYPYGGLFRTAQFNPFTKIGFLPLVPAVEDVASATLNVPFTALAGKSSGADSYVFALGRGTAPLTKTLYKIQLSDLSVVDYSDQIDQNAMGSQFDRKGATIYKSRLVYTQSSSLRSNTFTPTTANDTNILTTAGTGSTNYPTVFCVGPDGNLYYNAPTFGIGKIVSVTSTSGNTASAFTFTDTSLNAKDVTSDGNYLVFIADNNEYKELNGKTSCRIFFWDTINTKATQIFDIPDNYLISAKYVDGRILVIGASGIWSCNVATPPKLIYPLTTNKLPKDANSVTVKDNTLYWVANQIISRVYGYGAKVGNPILFNPFNLSSSTQLPLCFTDSGDTFLGAIDDTGGTAGIKFFDMNGTGVSAAAQTAFIRLDKPYKFSFAKVTLRRALASGESVSLYLSNGNNQVIMDTTLKTFSEVGAKQTLIFNPKPFAGGSSQFEDISIVVVESGVEISRVAIYGEPIEDFYQNI